MCAGSQTGVFPGSDAMAARHVPTSYFGEVHRCRLVYTTNRSMTEGVIHQVNYPETGAAGLCAGASSIPAARRVRRMNVCLVQIRLDTGYHRVLRSSELVEDGVGSISFGH